MANQLQQKVVALENEIRELGSNQAAQAEVIESHRGTIYWLECNLQRQQQGFVTTYDASSAPEHPVVAHTPYQDGVSISNRPSNFISSGPPSSNEPPPSDGTGRNTGRKRKHQGAGDGGSLKRNCTRD
jgi:hypothetical protein